VWNPPLPPPPPRSSLLLLLLYDGDEKKGSGFPMPKEEVLGREGGMEVSSGMGFMLTESESDRSLVLRRPLLSLS